jgi:hypothetical protein
MYDRFSLLTLEPQFTPEEPTDLTATAPPWVLEISESS